MRSRRQAQTLTRHPSPRPRPKQPPMSAPPIPPPRTGTCWQPTTLRPTGHGFVDAPRQAVAQADGLVAELMQHLAKTFADERGRLEGQWDQGEDVSTEDLRTAFQRYRLFFERLLTT